MIEKIFNLQNILIITLVLFGVGKNIYDDEDYDSVNKVPSAIYHMYTTDGIYHFIGKIRQDDSSNITEKIKSILNLQINKTEGFVNIAEMVKSRFIQHLTNDENFIIAKQKGKIWKYKILLSNEDRRTYDSKGWTLLETVLNEQVFISKFCNTKGKLFNKLKPIENQYTIDESWEASKSNSGNLYEYTIENKIPVFIDVDENCFI